MAASKYSGAKMGLVGKVIIQGSHSPIQHSVIIYHLSYSFGFSLLSDRISFFFFSIYHSSAGLTSISFGYMMMFWRAHEAILEWGQWFLYPCIPVSSIWIYSVEGIDFRSCLPIYNHLTAINRTQKGAAWTRACSVSFYQIHVTYILLMHKSQICNSI